MTSTLRLSTLMTLAALALPVLATPSLQQTGNIAYSCSGRGNGNAYNGIDLHNGFYAGQFKCKESSVDLALTVKAASHYTGPAGGSAKGKSKGVVGKAAAQASSSTLGDEANQSLTGFVDRWTISVPGVDVASPLILTVRVKVQGNLEAHGLSGSAGLSTSVFKDGANAGGNTWGIRSEVGNLDVFLPVNDSATASMMISNTWPFWLATTLKAVSGVAAAGAPGSAKASTPAAGLLWDGVVELRDYWTGQVYTGWSLTTDSGIDWRQPCPCTLP